MPVLNFVYCVQGEDFAELAAKSADTIRRNYPDAEIVFYVDQNYPALGWHRQIVYPEAFAHPFMVCNVLCQVDWMYVQGAFDTSAYTVFLDADVIHSRPLDTDLLDDKGADLYPTYRRDMGALSDQQPYNYGVLIVRHSTSAIHAMAWLLQRVMQMAPHRQKWYGNQIALRELCGPLKPLDVYDREFGYFTVKIAQLPCDTWNWSPHPKHAKQPGTSKHFIHLKGKLKDNYFEHFYDKVMAR